MAPSHVDLSVLWVPIMPETSKLGEQMEQVGQEATESFGKGSTGLGDKIHESVTKSKDKIKDVFHRTGSDAGKSMSDAFKEETKAVEDIAGDAGKKAKGKFKESTKGWGKVLVDAVGPETKKMLGDRLEEAVGGALEGVLGDNAKWAGKLSHTVADWGFDELKNKLGDTKDAAAKTRQAFVDFGNGDTTAGVSKLVDGMGKLGIETKDLPGPLQDAVGKLGEAKKTAQGFADIFNGLPGKVGLVGKAIEGLAGPLAVALAAAKDIDDLIRQDGLDPNAKGPAAKQQYEDAFHRIHRDANGNIVVDPKAPKPPGVDMGGVGGIGTGGDVLGSSQDAYDAFSNGKPLPAAPSGSTAQSWFNSAPRNVGSDQGLTPTSKSVKEVVSTLFPQVNDIGGWRPPDGYNEHSSGQALDVMIPGSNTPQGKQLGDQIRDYVMKNAKSLGVDYALWQQTQWNPDGSHSGMGDRGSPTQNHMDHVHIHTVKGGGDPNAPMPSMPRAGGTTASGDKIPTGAQHDPLFVSAAGGGAGGSGAAGAAGGDSDSSSLAQQLGSGFLGGVAQSVGLDGSVFKTFSGASNPMDFGITKIGTGLLNWASGMMPAISGHSPKQQQQGHTYNVDQSFNLTQHGVEGQGETPYKAAMNSSNRTSALAANMPGQ